MKIHEFPVLRAKLKDCASVLLMPSWHRLSEKEAADKANSMLSKAKQMRRIGWCM